MIDIVVWCFQFFFHYVYKWHINKKPVPRILIIGDTT